MELSIGQVERNLRHGFDQVGALVPDLPSSPARTRAQHAQQVFAKIGWSSIDAYGGVRVLRPMLAPGPLWIGVVPDSSAHRLRVPATFQTEPDNFVPGGVLLKVRTVPFTSLWAGFVLFHELSHVFDFASGLESRDPTPEEFAQGEVRAFHLEMTLIDAHTQGGLTAALTLHAERIRALTPAEAAEDAANELAGDLEEAAFGAVSQADSENEQGLREMFFLAAALISGHFNTPAPLEIERPEDAAGTYHEFHQAWRRQMGV